jgi:hypothetical protein
VLFFTNKNPQAAETLANQGFFLAETFAGINACIFLRHFF